MRLFKTDKSLVFIVNDVYQEFAITEEELDVVWVNRMNLPGEVLNFLVTSRNFHALDMELRGIELFVKEFSPKTDCRVHCKVLVHLELLKKPIIY